VVLGPRTLVGSSRPGGTPFSTLTVSVDGGRTWSAATRDPRPAPAVPAGDGVICWLSAVTSQSCVLYAVDPAAGRFAVIAAQPPIALGPATAVLNVGGRLWVAGTDPVSGRPATAVSADAGRTWSVRVFTTVAGCSPGRCVAPELSTVDGRTAYAVAIDFQAGQRLVYRSVDSDGWEQVGVVSTGESQRPPGSSGKTFITTDGTLVLCETVVELYQPIGCRFWAARGGASAYQQVTLDGLPAGTGSVRRTPDGWFYTYSSVNDILYGSTDGWHWTPVTSR
jgi:hypothetical protein